MTLDHKQLTRISDVISNELNTNKLMAEKIGLTLDTIRKQHATKVYSTQLILKLAEHLNYSLDYLYFGFGNKKRSWSKEEISEAEKYKMILINWAKETKKNGQKFADAQLMNTVENLFKSEV